MSLPRELLEDLLSRYMDGSLSDDERRRVEQILAVDEAAQKALAALQEQASLLRELHRTSPKLDRRFAQRVVDSAINQAIEQGLPAKHPLRLADPNRDGHKTDKGRPVRRHLQLLVGLAIAASVALLALTMRGYSPEEQALVENSPTPKQVDGSKPPEANVSGSETALAVDVDTGTAQMDRQMDDTGSRIATNPAPTVEPTPSIAATTENTESVNNLESPGDRIAMAAPSSQPPANLPDLDNAVNLELPASLDSLNMLMVYEIEVTQTGRERNVVGRIFKQAGIVQGDRRNIEENLVGFLKKEKFLGSTESESGEGENQVGMLLLEGSGIKLDRLMTDFYMAREEISKVGFQIAFGAPLSINTTEPIVPSQSAPLEGNSKKAPTIQPSEDNLQKSQMVIARRLVRNGLGGDTSETFSAGTNELAPWSPQSSASPLGTASPSASSLGSSGQTPDITAQVLLIIRQAP